MADYSVYSAEAPEFTALAARTPIPPAGLQPGQTIIQLREATNTGRETVSAEDLKVSGLDKTVTWQDHSILARDGYSIPARAYVSTFFEDENGKAVYLFFHGGGYLFGTVESENAICARIVDGLAKRGVPVVVLSVCYRHTPEWKFPIAHNDAMDSLDWILTPANLALIRGSAEKILVGGISAGGGLAASVALRENERREKGSKSRIRGQMLCIPWILHPDAVEWHRLKSRELSSFIENANAPVLPRKQVDLFIDALEIKDPMDPVLNVGLAAEEAVKGMPKTSVIVAGMDPLRDEGLLYADKLQRNGVPINVHIFPGLPHGFRRFANLKASSRWDDVVNESLAWMLSDNEPLGEWVVEGS